MRRAAVLAAALVAFSGGSAWGQEAEAPPSATPAPTTKAKSPSKKSPSSSSEAQRKAREEIEALKARIAAQDATIAKQDEMIRALEERLAKLEALAKASEDRLEAIRRETPEQATAVAPTLEERLKKLETEVSKLPEAADVVSVGEFPGSFRIPGTDAALKIGGQVRVTAVESLDAIGTDDRFVTSSIPVASSEEAGKGARTTLSANASRFNFDFRTPTGVGAMRAFIEVGFGGGRRRHVSHPSPRLRAMGSLDPRPDVVHVLGPRGRAVRHRQRGPERDLPLPPAADPVHDELRRRLHARRLRSRIRRRTSRTRRA